MSSVNDPPSTTDQRKKQRKRKPVVEAPEGECVAVSKAVSVCLKEHQFQREPCEGLFEIYKKCLREAQEEVRREKSQKGGGLF
ncbi:MAG: hypothetical protein Q8P67_21830 [archaeon]|nr:hypothetical protein [archaeon]